MNREEGQSVQITGSLFFFFFSFTNNGLLYNINYPRVFQSKKILQGLKDFDGDSGGPESGNQDLPRRQVGHGWGWPLAQASATMTIHGEIRRMIKQTKAEQASRRRREGAPESSTNTTLFILSDREVELTQSTEVDLKFLMALQQLGIRRGDSGGGGGRSGGEEVVGRPRLDQGSCPTRDAFLDKSI